MFGEHLNGFTAFDINSLNEDESMYDSEEENLIQYAQSVQNEPLAYQEMPVSVCESNKFSHFGLILSFIFNIFA